MPRSYGGRFGPGESVAPRWMTSRGASLVPRGGADAVTGHDRDGKDHARGDESDDRRGDRVRGEVRDGADDECDDRETEAAVADPLAELHEVRDPRPPPEDRILV